VILPGAWGVTRATFVAGCMILSVLLFIPYLLFGSVAVIGDCAAFVGREVATRCRDQLETLRDQL
jgi:hypothetical protein